MSGPGRNDPCPCGSGRNYRHCCLTRAQAATGITPADRGQVLDALLRYTQRPEFDEIVLDAALMWVGGEPEDDPRDALEDIVSHDTARETFFEWSSSTCCSTTSAPSPTSSWNGRDSRSTRAHWTTCA